MHCPFSQSGSGGLRCELQWWARAVLLSHCSASWRQNRAGGTKETLELQTRSLRAEMGYKGVGERRCSHVRFACQRLHRLFFSRSALSAYRLSLKPPTCKDSESVFYYFVYALFFSHTYVASNHRNLLRRRWYLVNDESTSRLVRIL